MKKEKTLTTLLLVIAVFMFTGLAYAYLGGALSNANKQTAQITTGTMNLTFADGSAALNATQMTIGDSVTKTFTIENKGTLDAKASMYFKDLVNTYMAESMSYRLEQSTSENGTYSVIKPETNVPQSSTASEKLLYGNITVPAGTKLYYKLIITFNNLPDVDQTQDIDAILNTKFTLKANKPVPGGEAGITLAALGLSPTSEGIHAAEDNYGISYYFIDDIANNSVKFGTEPSYKEYCYNRLTKVNDSEAEYWMDHPYVEWYDSKEECFDGGWNACDGYAYKPVCYDFQEECEYDYSMDEFSHSECLGANPTYEDITWKIIRINGDGTLRIMRTYGLYGEWYYESVQYAEGWGEMYNFYSESLLNNYGSNISYSTMFCEDKNYSGNVILYSAWGDGTFEFSSEYGGDPIDFYEHDAVDRMNNPSLYCNPPRAGMNTGETQLTVGNGLTYPIGLITADEASLSGLNWGWTMTPYYTMVNDEGYGSTIIYAASNGMQTEWYGPSSNDFYPVINLTAEYARTLVWDTVNEYYEAG